MLIAELDSNNYIVNTSAFDPAEFNFSQGVEFLKNVFGDKVFIEVSDAVGVGSFYDEERDLFVSPRNYESWTFNYDTLEWEPPVARPARDGKTAYNWDEATLAWVAQV